MPTSPKVISAHLYTDGSPLGWWPLTTPFNLAFVNPLDAPQLQVKGCYVGGNGHLQSLWDSSGGSLWYQFNLLDHRSRDLRCSPFGLLRGWLRYGGSWSMVVFLGGVGWRTWGNEIQLPSRACTDILPPVLPLPIQFLCSPSVFSCCASSLSELTLLNKSRP